MEKLGLSPAKVSKRSLEPKYCTENTITKYFQKRQRDADSDTRESPLKIRKTDCNAEAHTVPVDLIFDSDDSFKAADAVIDLTDDKENSPKKNTVVMSSKAAEICERDDVKKIKSQETTQRDYFGDCDSASFNELLSQFTDSDEEACDSISKQSTVGSLCSQDKVKNLDSGLQSLGPSQPSTQGASVNSSELAGELNDIDELFDDEWDDASKYCLDLSDFKRCNIVDIDRKRTSIYVTVADTEPESRATALVICSGTWVDMQVEVGESIIIKAKKSFGEWIVNNEWGMCITLPDILVSGTSVVSGLWCNRRGVLQQRFLGIDCLPNLKPNDAAMTCGSIVHEILQKALQEKLYSLGEIQRLFSKILKEPHTIQMLYASDLTLEAFHKMVNEYIPRIHEFLDRYIKGKQPDKVDKNFTGQIVCVRDIEENVWLPTLGLKGKIDVTVEVKIHDRRKVMPLEIKTGRTSFSAEHKGQLYLYVMMLKILGHDVDSGLLLYIKENQMQEIKSTIHEQRGLISMRNSMARYLSKPVVSITHAAPNERAWELMDLPEPIYHAQGCRNCAYNTLCCVYADADQNLSLSDHHPIAQLSKTIVSELTDEHINYVMNWIAMLELEDQQSRQSDMAKEVWSLKPEVREKRRNCLSWMEITKVTAYEDNIYEHELVRTKKREQKFPVEDFQEVFSEEDYVMISTCKRVRINVGKVAFVNKNSVVINFDKDFTRWSKDTFYHLDRCMQRNWTSRNFAIVATLLSPNDITRRMRRIIIDREPTTFAKELPKGIDSPQAREILGRLNEFQQKALKAVIKTNDYVLIRGMPGTGKTETIVALIQMLTLLERSVIITAHTHVAVDNILLKLNERNVDFLRLGNVDRVHPELLHKSDAVVIQCCDTPEKLAALYNKQKIIGVTCLGASHVLLSKRIFDYCIVDECTQVLQPVLLRPLYSADKFVFVGDPEQLPAVVINNEARKLGMDEDIFNRLDSPNNTCVLRIQYRMNKTIMDLANKFTYKGELRVGNEEIAKATLQLKNSKLIESHPKWIQKALSTALEDAITVLDTGETFQLSFFKKDDREATTSDKENVFSCKCSNWYEISLVLRLINTLVKAGVATQDIGVIAPFRSQINLLRSTIKHDIEINTVDQYQGRDKSVILFSCTRSNRNEFKRSSEYRILEDHKRLNVAVTRAKHKLIIIGDVKFLEDAAEPTRHLLNILKDNIVKLKPGNDDFTWENVLEDLPLSDIPNKL